MTPPPPRKHLGQHFLRDQKVVQKIVGDCPEDCQAIVEVGPGSGVLTQFLVQLQRPFLAIEKDPRFEDTLTKLLKSSQHLLIADALEVDYQKLAQQYLEGHPFWLVSNLPYQIAAPLMVKLFTLPQAQAMTLMMQREVAEKIHPPGNKPQASSLWALAQTYFHVSKLTHVSPGAFHPPPQVDSTVLSFKRRAHPAIALNDFTSFESFLRKLFSHRRKQLLGVLCGHYSRPQVEESLKELQLPTTLRAERLDLQAAQILFKRLHG